MRLNGHGPSGEDTIALVFAIEARFADLCDAFQRIMGTPLIIQDDIMKAYLRWKELVERFKVNDYRNSPDELKAVRVFAQWTVDINCMIRNQTPKDVEWSDV